MTGIVLNLAIDWRCKHTWIIASYNTSWCLLGCAIGDICGGIFISHVFDFFRWHHLGIKKD